MDLYFKAGVNLIKLLQILFTSVAFVLRFKTIATSENYTCRSIIELTPVE